MAFVGVALVTKIMEKLIEVGFSYLADQWHSGGMKDELQRLEVTLPLIKAVVEAADNAWEQQTANRDHLQAWLQQFKDALYEADDALDELEYLRLQKQAEADDDKRDEDHNKVRRWISNSKQSVIKSGKRFFKPDPTPTNLRRAVKRLDEVAARVGDFMALVSSVQQSHHQQHQSRTMISRETGTLVTETIVFGRDRERGELLQWLMMGQPDQDEKNDVSLYSVVGLGGIGKTTLVQLVYNDENVQKSFDLKMWVCVSTSFDVRHITTAMLERATKKRSEIDNLATLQDALKDKLMSSNKFLLVLDDVWDDQKNCTDWDSLLAPLRYGHKGSKILLTTRMDEVAKEAARAMGGSTKEFLKLNPIHEDAFFLLFKIYAFAGISSGDYKELQSIGTKIAERLMGSSLAAKIIGGLLNSKLDERYWRSILHCENISDHGGNIMAILMLSYHRLPLYLRPCFAFCSTFPQDYEFDKEDLVLKWMALGLIQHSPRNQGRTLEDIGRYYFDELFNRSFFEQKICFNSKCYYIMHDLLHDMARLVSHGECFSIVNDDKSVEDIPNTVRHLYLATNNLNLVTVEKWQQLRSLQLRISYGVLPEFAEVLEKVFRSLKCVRMLEVCVDGMRVPLPDVFGHLRHLRSLRISAEIDKYPASLRKLHNLQVLKLTFDDSTAALPIMLPNKRSSRYFFTLSQYNRFQCNLGSRGSESSDSFRSELSETVTSFPNPTTQDSPFLYHFDEISCAIRDPLSEHLSSSSWICSLREQKAIVFRRRLLDGEILQSAISSISGIRHPSLARLLGAALNGDHIFIIYECIADSATLKQCLNSSSFSNWVLRLQVALDVSMGLEYIHRDCDTVHAMISSSSIIVTEPNFNAKIVLFGAASDPATSADEDVEMRAKRLAGDLFSIEEPTGYVAPEVLAGGGRMSKESDVFALGMLILELVSGKIPLEYRMNKISLKCERISVIETAKHAVGSDGDKLETEERKRRIRMWVDQKLVNPFPDGVAEELIRLGLLCVEEDPSMRPEVASVTETIVKHLAPFLPSHPTWWRKEGQIAERSLEYESIVSSIDRAEMWCLARLKPDGTYMTDESQEVAKRIESITQSVSQGDIHLSGLNDVLTNAIGTSEHPGRVRAIGQAVPIGKYFHEPRQRRRTMTEDAMNRLLDVKVKAKVEEMMNEFMLKYQPRTSPHHEDNEDVRTPCPPPKSGYDSCSVSKDLSQIPEGSYKCDLAIDHDHKKLVVARGKVYNIGGDAQFLHNQPLEADNVRVSITKPIVEGALLPFPTNDIKFIGDDATGTFFKWPKRLVILDTKTTDKEKDVTQPSAGESLPSKGSLSNNLPKHNVEKESTSNSLKAVLTIAKMMKNGQIFSIPMHKDIFGYELKYMPLDQHEILQFVGKKEIGAACISIYMMYLFILCGKMNIGHMYGFICPHRIALMATSTRTEKANYIAETMKGCEPGRLYFAPYNAGGHWMLCVIDPHKTTVYWLDPLLGSVRDDIENMINSAVAMFISARGIKNVRATNIKAMWKCIQCPHQPDTVVCGYYVMKFMREIIASKMKNILIKFNSKLVYTDEEVDAVREEWAHFIVEQV